MEGVRDQGFGRTDLNIIGSRLSIPSILSILSITNKELKVEFYRTNSLRAVAG
jgi:hypothetical protein